MLAQASFESNYATQLPGQSASGSGGGLYFETLGGIALSMAERSSFVRNAAGANGGAVAAVQATRNSPSNLGMIYLPAYVSPAPSRTNVPALCYSTVNASNGTSTFREYSYASPVLVAHETVFDSNRAGGATAIAPGGSGGTTKSYTSSSGGSQAAGSGGALYLVDLRANISSSTVTSNEAGLAGGAVFLESGTSALIVAGTADSPTRVSNNSAPGGGSTIFSSSFGAVEIAGSSVVDLGGRDRGAGITVIAGGRLNFGEAGEASGWFIVFTCLPVCDEWMRWVGE
jgi:hypothetical protein